MFRPELRGPTKELKRFFLEGCKAFKPVVKSEIVEVFEDSISLTRSAFSKVEGVYRKLVITLGRIKQIKIRQITRRLLKRRVMVARRNGMVVRKIARRKAMVVNNKGGAEIRAERLEKAVFALTAFVWTMVEYLTGSNNIRTPTVLKVSSSADVCYAGSIVKRQDFKPKLQIATGYLPVKAGPRGGIQYGGFTDFLLVLTGQNFWYTCV